MFGADRPVYATPIENLRAAQAAADDLDHLESDEHRCMTERIQQLIDAAVAVQEASCQAEDPGQRVENLPLRRDQGATSQTPTRGVHDKRDKEPTASRSRTRLTIEQIGRASCRERV